ncbi:PAQR family membrane homeostasis protein TrhA [Vaccinium witches'-broom phytoplasma]|uniref:PAQR family membrane homeostasis protein TrhA n=1 Tax=Vaccinium witches'-broom phytoplasma TaxID=85642 RepID=UPI00037E4C98|nr:hemolysin III family protein [Vaccinium witches'-broom phytoplasma]
MNWPTKKVERQTIGEEIANAISHGIMVPLSIFIFCFFHKCSLHDKGHSRIPLFAFIVTMMILYSMSSLYHALAFTKAKKLFQRFDHISIYLLIWGSFFPFLFLKLDQELFSIDNLKVTKGWFFFLIQTIVVFIGISFKILSFDKGKKIHLFLFLILGWSGLFLIHSLWDLKKSLFFLVLGGVAYSAGVIFYNNSYKKYYHFIWHLFVNAGNLLHVAAIHYMLEKL